MKTICTLLFTLSLALSMSNSWAMEKPLGEQPPRVGATQPALTGREMDADVIRAHERFIEKQKTKRNRDRQNTLTTLIGVSGVFVIPTVAIALSVVYLLKKS